MATNIVMKRDALFSSTCRYSILHVTHWVTQAVEFWAGMKDMPILNDERHKYNNIEICHFLTSVHVNAYMLPYKI
jgi:hypothetical protein